MTLIIGVKCSDGIVVGADGAATLGVSGTQTAQQRTVKKLSILHGRMIVGVAGSVGVGQRLRALVDEAFRAGRYKDKRPELVMTDMRAQFWNEILQHEWMVASATAGLIGAQAAVLSANTTMLVALPIEGKAELIQFDNQCAPEMATSELPFVTIGGGQPNADPFMGFIRRVFWPRGCPGVSVATFSVLWALRHAIDTVPGGVAGPVQIVALEKHKHEWSARELPDAEIAQHDEAIKDAERALTEWRSQLTNAASGDAPEKPPS